MASHSYAVAADFHIRAGPIEAMKQLIAEVTAPSLDEEGCQIYRRSQGEDDPTLFLLYMEWREKACFEDARRAVERMALPWTLRVNGHERPGGKDDVIRTQSTNPPSALVVSQLPWLASSRVPRSEQPMDLSQVP